MFGVRRRRLVGFAVFVASVLALLVFYRVILESGGDAVPGKLGDGFYNLAVLEHWHRVVLGREGWASPSWYYPVEGVLGYSDALVLLAPFFVGARLLGADQIAAMAVTLGLVSAVGFAGMLVFLRRLLGLVWPAALAGAAGFATASALYQSLAVGHLQMLAVQAVPWLACSVWLYLRHGRVVWGGAAALLLAALMTTSFYIGWFIGVQGLVIAGLLVALAAREVRLWLGAHRRSLAVVAVVLVAALVPFARLYLPVAMISPPRPWVEVERTLPDPVQSIEVRGNALWGPVEAALWPNRVGRGGELGKGVSWGELTVFLLTLGAVAVRRRPCGSSLQSEVVSAPEPVPNHRLPVLVLGGSVVVCWLLMLQVDGVSLWWAVYHGVPGGHSIRSVFRFNLVLGFSVATVAAIGLDRLSRAAGWWRLLVGPLATLIMVEQVNVLPNVLSRSHDFAAIMAVPPAPATCRAFVLLPAVPDVTLRRWSRQMAAVLVAQARDVPTINGYSGMAPPAWALYDPTDGPGYRQGVAAWADRYNLWPGLCGLDLDAARWFSVARP